MCVAHTVCRMPIVFLYQKKYCNRKKSLCIYMHSCKIDILFGHLRHFPGKKTSNKDSQHRWQHTYTGIQSMECCSIYDVVLLIAFHKLYIAWLVENTCYCSTLLCMCASILLPMAFVRWQMPFECSCIGIFSVEFMQLTLNIHRNRHSLHTRSLEDSIGVPY